MAGFWNFAFVQAFMDLADGFLYPGIVAVISYEGDVKFQLSVKSFSVSLAVAIDKVAGARNFIAVPAKKPLINFHLSFVAVLPILIKFVYLPAFGSSLIIHNDIFALGILPKVVNGAGYEQIGRLVQVLDSGKIMPPLVQIVVRNGPGIDAVFLNQRMLRPAQAMNVKLQLQKMVDGRVKRKRIAGRTADTKPAIMVKAPRALQKQVNF